PVIRLDREVERGAPLEVDRDALPPLQDDSYYVFDLVGLEVEEEGGRSLGTVAEVTPEPANDVLELSTWISLPLADACVRRGRALERDRAPARRRVRAGGRPRAAPDPRRGGLRRPRLTCCRPSFA